MASTERLVVLDFIRGVAVLGIFVINIESFAFADAFSPYRSGFNTGLDRDFRFWTYFLFQGKFFGLFALLFGVGFHLFLEKACRSGSRGIDSMPTGCSGCSLLERCTPTCFGRETSSTTMPCVGCFFFPHAACEYGTWPYACSSWAC